MVRRLRIGARVNRTAPLCLTSATILFVACSSAPTNNLADAGSQNPAPDAAAPAPDAQPQPGRDGGVEADSGPADSGDLPFMPTWDAKSGTPRNAGRWGTPMV